MLRGLEEGRESCGRSTNDKRYPFMAPCALSQHHRGSCVPSVADYQLDWIPVPTDPFSRITEGLYQGGSTVTPTKERFDVVLTLDGSARASDVGLGVRERRWIIDDGPILPDPGEFEQSVRWVVEHWQDGDRVLVRCQAGLNRSGLVVAAVLIRAGATPDEAIDLVRQQRSPFALCNANFYRKLREFS
jgi:hypothetical protein